MHGKLFLKSVVGPAFEPGSYDIKTHARDHLWPLPLLPEPGPHGRRGLPRVAGGASFVTSCFPEEAPSPGRALQTSKPKDYSGRKWGADFPSPAVLPPREMEGGASSLGHWMIPTLPHPGNPLRAQNPQNRLVKMKHFPLGLPKN